MKPPASELQFLASPGEIDVRPQPKQSYLSGIQVREWGTPGQERGFDRSDVSPITLATLELTVELASNSKERGTDVVDTSRSRIDIKKKPNEIEIVIPDPEPGQRWYKLVFRSRKR